MKNKITVLLFIILILIISPVITNAAEFSLLTDDISIGQLIMQEDSSKLSDITALQLLALCSGFNEENEKELFESAKLDVLASCNYDKDADDPQHTCAYTIGEGHVLKGFKPQKALVIAIRGTNSGEWYSNFDFCPSHSDEALFAENFLFSAEEAFESFLKYYDSDTDPLVIVCGHSRGAACANLLGVLLDSYIDKNNVYVYSFATPATIRKGAMDEGFDNIFNYINPNDIVPELPLSDWNFIRAGKDVVLNTDSDYPQTIIKRYISILSGIASTIRSYYMDRHSLTEAGLSESGITAFELMLMLCSKLVDFTENIFMEDDMEISNPPADQNDLSIISESSDLYPIAEILTEISDNEFAKGKDILKEHLPTTYMQLIEARLTNTKTGE